MITNLIERARGDVRALKPYQSAKRIAQDLGHQGEVWLDANLNPYAPYPDDGTTAGFNRYADPQPQDLCALLASLYEAPLEMLLLTRGSDEAIDLLIRAFCEAGKDSIVVCPPTFGMYELSAKIQGARVHAVPLQAENGFQLDVQGIIKACDDDPSVKLVFFPSPSAPMGHIIDEASIVTLCRALAGRALVVVDEAYWEFAKITSMVRFMTELPNLAILRTLSKAYGMAGLRIGALLAQPEVISLAQRLQAPYPLTVPSINAALNALQPKGLKRMKERTEELIRERARMTERLATLPYVQKIYPSVTNFIFMVVDDAESVLAACHHAGIILRSQTYQFPNAIRFSMGTPQENDRLWDVLKGLG